MKSIRQWSLLASLILSLFTGCSKLPASNDVNTPPTSFSGIFDQFWSDMNTNYVYWDIDTTNWDQIYQIYKPLFNNLQLDNPGDERKSVTYFRTMTGGLIDSHFSLSFMPSSIADSVVFPALDRKIQSPGFHSPFLYSSIDTGYFDPGYVLGQFINSSNAAVYAAAATIHQKILYFTCNQFSLHEAWQSPDSNGVATVLSWFFNRLSPTYSISAIIIDVRGNSGGDFTDLGFLIGRLISRPLPFGFTRYKNGPGRLDYTPWIEATIEPSSAGPVPTTLIMALADNYSISLAETIAMAIHTLPNGKVIGETTWGATGPYTNNQVYNDGPFSITGFLSAYTSSGEFKYIDGKSYEGNGFPPDLYIPFDLNALLMGDDSALDAAVREVN
jgi:hypothetical protein